MATCIQVSFLSGEVLVHVIVEYILIINHFRDKHARWSNWKELGK